MFRPGLRSCSILSVCVLQMLNGIRDEVSGSQRFIAVLHDVTELKALLATNKIMFEATRSPMVVADEKGKITQVNEMVHEIFGYTKVCVLHLVT